MQVAHVEILTVTPGSGTAFGFTRIRVTKLYKYPTSSALADLMSLTGLSQRLKIKHIPVVPIRGKLRPRLRYVRVEL